MTTWAWTVIVLMALSAIGKLQHLSTDPDARTTSRNMDAFDIVLGVIMVVWGCVVLLK